MEKIEYKGWQGLKLTEAGIEIVVPTEIGPRIVHCSLPGQDNLFAERAAEMGGRDEPEFMLRGGHRLWHSPEHPVRTYAPDNSPPVIDWMPGEEGFVIRGAREANTGMSKTIRVEVIGEATLRVTHTIENENLWPIEFAAWALSIMKHGGYAAIPLNPKIPHTDALLPNYVMVPWTYTDFSEPAWEFHPDFIGIDVSKSVRPQKLGLSSYPGWSAYWQPEGTFVKYAPVVAGARYPDFGSAFETFHCDWMIELENLSPLKLVSPGESVELVEHWTVLTGIEKPDSMESYHRSLLPAVDRWLIGIR